MNAAIKVNDQVIINGDMIGIVIKVRQGRKSVSLQVRTQYNGIKNVDASAAVIASF